MSKNILIIVIVLVAIIGGAIIVLNGKPATEPYQKESLTVEQELSAVENVPIEDITSSALQSVRTSDELDAIEADLNETDLSGLDAELQSIESDLSGL